MKQQGGEILIFEVEGRRYGLPVSDVEELLRAVTIVPLPLAPAGIEGVVNLRGSVIHVHDLRARLGLPPKGVEPSDQLIVTRSPGSPAAIRMDRAVELASSEVVDAEDQSHGELTLGVARLPSGLAPILDLNALLARPAKERP